jgi:hypothetical protein
MLASITPLGERARRSMWGVTITAFALGATAAGAAGGAAAGFLGAEVGLGGAADHTRLAVVAGALAVAIALDTVPRALPGPRRQVDERWLVRYRGWVYGLGYGAQLGFGLVTVVSSAATYVAFLAAFLSARPGAGALILGCFGAVRGLTPLAAVHVRSQRQLLELHRQLGRRRSAARWWAVGVQVAILAAAVAEAGA